MAKTSFSIGGEGASASSGKFHFYEGAYSAVLLHMTNKGLEKSNVLEIGHNGTNYYIFYWK